MCWTAIALAPTPKHGQFKCKFVLKWSPQELLIHYCPTRYGLSTRLMAAPRALGGCSSRATVPRWEAP